jgi:Pectate lyase superfamily protein
MPIFQISQITNRTGLQIDLPQLAGGELGWSTDTRQLWIGNGTLEQGAPVVGNTEILTEFSDILSLNTTYTYKGLAAGYPVQTGPTASTPITLSLQSWMDQWASVKDFGATGDGVTDDTAAINRALYQLYCREINPQIRRSLYFPAGVYKISGTIYIPPFATLYGEGIENSVIQASTATNNLPYVFRTCDSLQQYGSNIGNNNAIPPRDITISNMGFGTLGIQSNLFLLEDVSDVTFNSVSLYGPYVKSQLVNNYDDTSCVRFASNSGLVTNNITFNACTFSNMVYGVNTASSNTGTDQAVKSVSVTQSNLQTLYQGIVIGTQPLVAGGPTGFSITENVFDAIYDEGIFIGAAKLNATGYNIFYDVGDHFAGINSPYAPCITIQANNNVSIGDMFARDDAHSTNYVPGYSWPRIITTGTSSFAFTNSSQIALGSYVRTTGSTATLTNNVSSPTNIVSQNDGLPLSQNIGITPAFTVDYLITRGAAIRKGTLTVVAPIDNVSNPVMEDSFTENGSTGIVLSVSLDLDTIYVQYTSTNATNNATIKYSLNYFD